MTKDISARRVCFVVGPIRKSGTPERNYADWLNDGIIKPLFKESFPDFESVRADEIAAPGMIDSQVINHLFDADLVISDMSMRNANAFYEMGIRHAVQKPIIHMYKLGEEIPFDVQPYRAIEFSISHPADLSSAKDRLKLAIEHVLSAGYRPDNPVIRARGMVELAKNASDTERLLIDQIETLETRISRLEQKNPRETSIRLPKPRTLVLYALSNDKPTKKETEQLVSTLSDIAPPDAEITARTQGNSIKVDITSRTQLPDPQQIEAYVKKLNSWVISFDEIPF